MHSVLREPASTGSLRLQAGPGEVRETSAGTDLPLILFCGQVCGYRLRLHFDGYSECHDFWVNANSPDIHPAGWFEKTGHKLQLPKGKISLGLVSARQ